MKITGKDAARFGRLCQRAHALMVADSRLRMERALALAAAQLDEPLPLSPKMEAACLTTIARVLFSGNDVRRAAAGTPSPDDN